jgi:hypothetical protein
MPTVRLPDDPNLEQLRKQARDLQRSIRDGESADLVAEFDAPRDAKLSTAQLVVARRYGFRSWPALVAHVRVIAEHRRVPDEAPASDDPATEFLRRACLTYSGHDGTPAAATRPDPEIVQGDVWVAAACADVDMLARLLGAEPGLASREGGPHRWPPLLYLAYARRVPLGDPVGAARLLLDRGADPNAGFLWHGLTCPFTVLTGVFGEGEQGPVAQPRHPQEHALARLLLDRGADPNDGQALYNRMFQPADDHLELLFEYGLGTGDGGPWRRLLGPTATDSPQEMLRKQLGWAVTHGFTHRVQLLAEHGVDVRSPLHGYGVRRQTPHQAAVTSGQFEVARQLEELGAGSPLSATDQVLAAVLAADPAVRDADPAVLAAARASRPGLVVWAAVRGDIAAVRLAVELGWGVSTKGRSDGPGDTEWETALHHAAGDGNEELARVLLELGADPDVRDHRFDATPLGWAQHFDQPALVALLEPLTTPPT